MLGVLLIMLIFYGFVVLKIYVIGKSGWAAPRLKDAALSLDKLRECYLEVCPFFKQLLHYFELAQKVSSILLYFLFLLSIFFNFMNLFSDDTCNAEVIPKMQTSAWRSQ